jgi:hypothetical protein
MGKHVGNELPGPKQAAVWVKQVQLSYIEIDAGQGNLSHTH